LIKIEADRSWMLVGFGGGVTTDISGFAASTFLRGIRFGFVATSLLSQVDASVGGKNGVNVGNFKNMAGIFRQPEFVLCDSESLASLPDEELSSGLAEAIKHGVIRDAAYFDMIESAIGQAIAKDPETLEAIVEGSVRIKAKVVSEDEEESSLRRILNFGHSFGHAVELAYGLRHGYAVSIGMCFAGNFASSRGIFDKAAQARMEALLRKAGLPTSIRELRNKPNAGKLIQAMRHDKKRESSNIRFVLPEALGRARIESIPIREIEEAIEKECG
jgi:3-dehydroquinate synthase